MSINNRSALTIISTLFVLLTFIFCGCSNNTSINTKTGYDENGNFVSSSNGHYTTMYHSLPAILKYNDKEISLTHIDTWQTYENYNYCIFVKAVFDISNLSEAEIHWLVDEDFSCNAYATNEKNAVDFKGLVKTDWTYDSKTMTLLFSSASWHDSVRHSFDASDITICADAKQEETYEYTNAEGKTSNLHKTISFQCKMTFDTVPQKQN